MVTCLPNTRSDKCRLTALYKRTLQRHHYRNEPRCLLQETQDLDEEVELALQACRIWEQFEFRVAGMLDVDGLRPSLVKLAALAQNR